MDWLYGDDTPRAEQRAALLSLDRGLLDEVMGNVAHDDETLEALREIVARRKDALVHTEPERITEYGEGEGARRGMLAKYVALAGPVTVHELHERYGWPAAWIERRLAEWQRAGRVVIGKFRPDVTDTEYLSRKTAELARRRALATLRRQIQAVDMPHFAAFLQRWQHVDPRDHLTGVDGVGVAIRQLYGIARPAIAWERDYLESRITQYAPAWLSEWISQGEPVWIGEGNHDDTTQSISLTRVRFVERGTGRLWVPIDADVPLSAAARHVYETIVAEGASFIPDIQLATALTPLRVREALRELVAFSLVTNDTADAMRQIIRWKPLPPEVSYDPERWLPESFVSSDDRPVRHRRPNLRRLPRWHRPDKPGGTSIAGWTGRWSLVRKLGVLGAPLSEEEHAAAIARQWLARYGVVTRDWWRRERPPVGWRSIYNELKRLEFRGDVRRGYFVRGLAGAQFALPDAVERLRDVAATPFDDAPFVIMATSDPSNPYTLAMLEAADRDPLSRPRGSGGILVTRGGRVALSVEGRGRRLVAADWLSPQDRTEATRLLAGYVRGERDARHLP